MLPLRRLVLAPCVVLGCGESTFDPEAVRGDITIAVTADVQAAAPGDTFRVDIDAEPPRSGTISRLVVFIGFGGDLDSADLQYRRGGRAAGRLTFTVPLLPIEGDLFVFARADMTHQTAHSDTVRIAVGDAVRPFLVWRKSFSNRVAPGSLLVLPFRAEDGVGIVEAEGEVTGAMSYAVSRDYQIFREVVDSFLVPIPDVAPVGAALNVSLRVSDLLDNAASLQATVRIVDLTPPEITFDSILGGRAPGVWSPNPTFAYGDTVTVMVRASDEHGMRWLGIRFPGLGGLGDSVMVVGPSAERTLRVTVDPDNHVLAADLEVFARDSAGNRGRRIRAVTLFSVPAVATQSVSVSAPSMVARHPGQPVAYVLSRQERRLTVVGLDPLVAHSEIPLTAVPWAADLTHDGDTLVIAADDAVIWVDVSNPNAPTVARTELLSVGPRSARRIAVDADGRVIVGLHADEQVDSLLGIVDPLEGDIQVIATASPEAWDFVRTGDRSRIHARGGEILSAGTDTVLVVPALTGAGSLAANETGSGLLVGPDLYDGSHTFLRELLPPPNLLSWLDVPPVGVLLPDGEHALISYQTYMLTRVRLDDASIIQQVFLPVEPTSQGQLEWIEDMQSALAVGNGQVVLLDLR